MKKAIADLHLMILEFPQQYEPKSRQYNSFLNSPSSSINNILSPKPSTKNQKIPINNNIKAQQMQAKQERLFKEKLILEDNFISPIEKSFSSPKIIESLNYTQLNLKTEIGDENDDDVNIALINPFENREKLHTDNIKNVDNTPYNGGGSSGGIAFGNGVGGISNCNCSCACSPHGNYYSNQSKENPEFMNKHPIRKNAHYHHHMNSTPKKILYRSSLVLNLEEDKPKSNDQHPAKKTYSPKRLKKPRLMSLGNLNPTAKNSLIFDNITPDMSFMKKRDIQPIPPSLAQSLAQTLSQRLEINTSGKAHKKVHSLYAGFGMGGNSSGSSYIGNINEENGVNLQIDVRSPNHLPMLSTPTDNKGKGILQQQQHKPIIKLPSPYRILAFQKKQQYEVRMESFIMTSGLKYMNYENMPVPMHIKDSMIAASKK